MIEAASDMIARHRAILGELAELGLALARETQARALAAPDADDAQRLGLAFQRAARTVRQTLALEMRLEKLAEKELTAQEALRQIELGLRCIPVMQRRIDRVRLPLQDEIRAEFPAETGPDAEWREQLFTDLEDALVRDEVLDFFGREATEADVQAQIADIRDRLGLWGPEPEGQWDDPHIFYGTRVTIYPDGRQRKSPVRKFARRKPAAPEAGAAPSTPSGSPSP